jgi:hypothetical protein
LNCRLTLLLVAPLLVGGPAQAASEAEAQVRGGTRLAHAGLAMGGAGLLLIAAGIEKQSEPVLLLGSATTLIGSPLLATGALRANSGYRALGQTRGRGAGICAITLQGAGLLVELLAVTQREEAHYDNVTVYLGPDPTLSTIAGSAATAAGCSSFTAISTPPRTTRPRRPPPASTSARWARARAWR